MPPLPFLPPSNTQDLISRLNKLSDENKATVTLIQRLGKLDLQPGSLPLSPGSSFYGSLGSPGAQSFDEQSDARVELAAEIHERLKAADEELELLRQEVEDVLVASASGGGTNRHGRRDSRRASGKESERARLAVLLARLGEDLKISRSQFRRAQLSAKRAADRARQKERDLLFSNLQSAANSQPQSPSGTSTPTSPTGSQPALASFPHHRRARQTKTNTEDEVLLGASSDVTAALRRTQQLMQTELSRSRFAQETLEQSTAALADLGERYTDLSGLLTKSRTLVTTLLKSQKSDTWYLETTLYILLTTVIWLVFRRWLYGPITWFLIWPVKILFRIAFAIVPTASVASSSSSASVQQQLSSRTSLIVKPSATGKPPKLPTNADGKPLYVPVGAGGRGGYRPDPSPPGSYSQTVGKMAEEQQQPNQGEQKQGQEKVDGQEKNVHPQLREHKQQEVENGPVVRGDGTVLPERPSDKPVNPKKKMWDEGVESAKREHEQQEQEQAVAAGGEVKKTLRKRDEL